MAQYSVSFRRVLQPMASPFVSYSTITQDRRELDESPSRGAASDENREDCLWATGQHVFRTEAIPCKRGGGQRSVRQLRGNPSFCLVERQSLHCWAIWLPLPLLTPAHYTSYLRPWHLLSL